MATFFGEVVSVYSRAVGEDEEEDLDENEEDEHIRRELEEKRQVQLEWCPAVKESMQTSGSNMLQCSHFILAVGHNAASFLSVHVLNSASWETVGHASLWNERTRGSRGQKEPACTFFRHADTPSEVLICQNTCYTAEDQLFEWTEKVFGCLQKRGLSVTVLSDSPLTDYKTSDYLSSAPFLRSLRTSTYSSRPVCPPLEQPNIVTGLTASVLSHCQVHQIPAVAYQCYSDIISPDSVTMETYKPVLTCLSKCIKLDPCPSVDTLRKFVQTSEIQSNLYI